MNEFYIQVNKSVFSFKRFQNENLKEKIMNYININLKFDKNKTLDAKRNVIYLDYTEFYELIKVNYGPATIKHFFQDGFIPDVFICYLDTNNQIIKISRKEKYFTHTLNNPDVKPYPNNVSISRKEKSNLILENYMLTFSGYLRPVEEFQSKFV